MFPGESCERLLPWPFVRSHHPRTRLRQDYSGQVEDKSRRSQYVDRSPEGNQCQSDHGGPGARLRSQRQRADRQRLQQRSQQSVGSSESGSSEPLQRRAEITEGRTEQRRLTFRYAWLLLFLLLIPLKDSVA